MLESVKAFIKEHQLLTEQATIIVGVSGGPDSMALLHVLQSMKQSFGLHLIAVSVDHQLRGEAAKADIDYVEKTCDAWGIPFHGAKVSVAELQRTAKLSTEVAARTLRYQVFAEEMRHYQADYLALGHHGDDQIETMLMGLTRSAHLNGLKGMPLKRSFADGMLIRPLLCVDRKMIDEYCRCEHIYPRHDATNDVDAFTRNYFRKHVVPLLKQQNPNLYQTTQHLSIALQADEQFLQAKAIEVFERLAVWDEKALSIKFPIDSFLMVPIALQRRFYHLVLTYLYEELPKDLSYRHEEQFFSLLRGQGNVQMDFPKQLVLAKTYGDMHIYFKKATPNVPPFNEALSVPGELIMPDGTTINAEWTTDVDETNDTYIFHPDCVEWPLMVRTRRPGDRMTWKGLGGSKKVKAILIDAKIPTSERNKWPIITDNKGEILWLIGLKKRHFPTLPGSKKWVKLSYKSNDG